MHQQPSILEVERRQPDAAGPRVGTAARGTAGSLLRLQRTAGNRAVGALMATREPRVLARCGSGRCHCGGSCKREDDEEDKHSPGRARLQRPPTPQAPLALQRTPGNAAAPGVARRALALGARRTPERSPVPRTLARFAGRKHCSADEVRTPDADVHAAAGRGARFVVAADRESEDWFESTIGGEVGHSWVKLIDDGGSVYSFGFYPEVSTTASGMSEVGSLMHPDQAHDGKPGYIDLTLPLTEEAMESAFAFIAGRCEERLDYNLYTNNCTSFVIDVANAAGLQLAIGTGVVSEPNDVYEWIVEERARRAEAAKSDPAPLDPAPLDPAAAFSEENRTPYDVKKSDEQKKLVWGF
jgi:hypothetical protein